MAIQLGSQKAAAAKAAPPTKPAPPTNLEASAAAFRAQASNLDRAAKDVEGALTILRTGLKGNAATGGRVDSTAVSNAVNQLQNTVENLRAIAKTITS